ALLAVGVTVHIAEGGPFDIYVWEIASRRLLCRLAGHRHQIHCLAFSPNGRRLISASLDRTVRSWTLDSPDGPVEEGRRAYRDLEFGRLEVLTDGRVLISRNSEMEVWRDGRCTLTLRHGRRAYGCVWALSADERRIAASDRHQQVDVWSLEDGRHLASLAAA